MSNRDFYLIENMMGFERVVEGGSNEVLGIKQQDYERAPATRKVGSGSNEFVIKARYYIVPKDDWDIHNCPMIPVDFS